MKIDQLGEALMSSAAFAALGIVVFGIAFWLFRKFLPFSLRKEIEEDQNTSLGIIMGSVIIGISLLIVSRGRRRR